MNEAVLNKLYQYIDEHQEDTIRDLMSIVRIESVTRDGDAVKPFGQGCRNVLDAMLEKGKKEGFQTRNHEYYVGSIKYDLEKEKTIGILAHLDVVPAGDDWTVTAPYEPLLKDGLLFGRGAGDNKSAAIAGLYIAKAFRDAGVPLRHNIELLLGTNEETKMQDVQYYEAHYETPAFTFVPDAGFPGMAGEFGRLRFKLTSRASLSDDFVDAFAGSAFNIVPNKATLVLSRESRIDLSGLPADFEVKETERGIEVTGFGVTTHAAGPERGVNAVKVLTSAFLKLTGIRPEDRAILEFIDNVNQDFYGSFLGIDNTDEISGQTVSSGTVLRFNGGHVSLLNDCRYCVSDNGDRLEACIRAKADACGFDSETEEKTYGAYLDVNGPEITTIRKVYEEETGKEGEIRIGKGGTYAGQLKNAFATGCILREDRDWRPEYLPAGHGSAHQPDEFIEIGAYLRGIKLLLKMILAVDEVL